MAIPILKIINLLIILVMLFFVARYTWSLFSGSDFEPVGWEHARHQQRISRELGNAMKNYSDKVRFFGFWLQIQRLQRDDVPGAFAELGVYKGETAWLLHLMAPDRALHLFDTFEGLPEADLEVESGEAATYTNKNFRDTSEQKVRERFSSVQQKVFIHKGYFPETTNGLGDLTFALVSLDADLYNPTLEGLKYFYSRLSPGGVIFIHDYNYKWEGLQKAVDEFCAGIEETPVWMPDLYGSVLIVKTVQRAHNEGHA